MKYEYLVVRIPGGSRMTEERLNNLGNEGYELVAVTSSNRDWVFKRTKRVTRAKKSDA